MVAQGDGNCEADHRISPNHEKAYTEIRVFRALELNAKRG